MNVIHACSIPVNESGPTTSNMSPSGTFRSGLSIDTSELAIASSSDPVFLLDIPPDIVLYLLSDYLNLVDIAHLDTALCQSKHRKHFLSLLANPCIVYQAPAYQSNEFFAYITARRMQISHLSYKLLPPISRSRSGSLSTTSGYSAMTSPRSGSFSSPSLSRARSGSTVSIVNSSVVPPMVASPTSARGSKGPLLRLPSAVKPGSGASTVLSLASSSLSPSKDHTLKNRSCSFSYPSPVSSAATSSIASMQSHSADSVDKQQQPSGQLQSSELKASASVAHLTRRIRALSCDAASGKNLHEIVAIYTAQGYIAPTTLQQLNVTGYKKIDDATFLPLLSLCDNSDKIYRTTLVSVDLTGCWKLSDVVLQTLAQMHGRTLQEVNVSACFAFTEDGIVDFARQCPELRSFTAGFCEKIDDDVVLALLQACPKLRVLKLNACVSLTDEVALHIAQFGQQLEVVDLSGVTNLSDDFCKQFHLTQEVKQCYEELYPPPLPVEIPAENTVDNAADADADAPESDVLVSSADNSNSANVSLDANSLSSPSTPPLYIPPLPEDLLPVVPPQVPVPRPLPPCCPRLREMHLESCAKLSTEGIVHLVLACRQLQKVQLRYVLGVQQQVVAERMLAVEAHLATKKHNEEVHGTQQKTSNLRHNNDISNHNSNHNSNHTSNHNSNHHTNHISNQNNSAHVWSATSIPVRMQRALSFSV